MANPIRQRIRRAVEKVERLKPQLPSQHFEIVPNIYCRVDSSISDGATGDATVLYWDGNSWELTDPAWELTIHNQTGRSLASEDVVADWESQSGQYVVWSDATEVVAPASKLWQGYVYNGQSIPGTDSGAVVIFDNLDLDVNAPGSLNTSTGEFTFDEAGYFMHLVNLQVHYTLTFDDPPDSIQIFAHLQKNGTKISNAVGSAGDLSLNDPSGQNFTVTLPISWIGEADVDDVFTVYCKWFGSSSVTAEIDGDYNTGAYGDAVQSNWIIKGC